MAAISPALQTHRSPQKCLLALLALLALSKTPPLLTQRKLRHRSTRTLNPLALGAAAPSKPNFHHLHHTHHRAQRSVRPSSASPQANGRGGHFRHPGRWWQPCVTPYFADLGVGDMRGPPMGAPMMPPRRRWQAVITLHNIDTAQYSTIANATAPHHLRGAIWVGHHRPPPHVATTQRGEIRGYAQLQPLAG